MNTMAFAEGNTKMKSRLFLVVAAAAAVGVFGSASRCLAADAGGTCVTGCATCAQPVQGCQAAPCLYCGDWGCARCRGVIGNLMPRAVAPSGYPGMAFGRVRCQPGMVRGQMVPCVGCGGLGCTVCNGLGYTGGICARYYAMPYPYYTTRGPRDFLAPNPLPIGP